MSTRVPERALVSGASSGVGLAIARELAARGSRVVSLARRFEDAASGWPEPGQIRERRLDVRDESASAALAEDLAEVNALVLSAGNGVFAPALELTSADLRAMLETHVLGAFHLARAAGRAMRGRGGHILVIGSVAAARSFPGCAGYAAAKAAQAALLRGLGEELRGDGVRVTGVTLGATDTAIWDGRGDFDRTAMLRAGDVAEVCVDVLSRPDVYVEEIVLAPPHGDL